MAVTLQPQRVPLGTLTIAGKDYPVTITVEWYRVLQRLAGQASSASGQTGSGVTAGATSSGGSAASADAIDFDNGPDQALAVLAMALERGLDDLAGDSDVQALRAEVATLRARVDGLEQDT